VTRRRKADLPRDALGRLREAGQPDEMAHLRDLGERVEDPREAFERAAWLYDQRRYFEAYVHFTLAWKLDREGGYRGLAMIAGGLCHVQRGNPAGAIAVLTKGRDHLRRASPPGVDVPLLLDHVERVLDDLDAGEADPTAPRLPRT
jgi:uncharacterized protein